MMWSVLSRHQINVQGSISQRRKIDQEKDSIEDALATENTSLGRIKKYRVTYAELLAAGSMLKHLSGK
jgi:hypothetical protein